jgi:tetratricopeptide (TPR) repeat protein
MATVTNIGVFIAACWFIYLLWGFWPALLFSVLPTNVCGVAWTTGNYYMSTVLLTLCSHWFVMNLGLFGLAAGMGFYVAALGSTVNAIPYAFVLPFIKQDPLSLFMLFPLIFFLFGKRFQTGLKLRADKHKQLKIESGKVTWRAIFVMTKVVGYYIVLNLWPSRLGFFHEYPKWAHSNHADRLFWLNLALILSFSYLGFSYSFEGTIWWFLFIGIFSQFTTYGMFVAERYMVLANVGFCLILSAYFAGNETVLAVISTLYFCQSWGYVRAYKNNVSLFSHSISAFPQAPENYNNLASHYIERGYKDKAIEPLLVALKLTGVNSPNIHVNLANCYAKVGYFQKSLEHTNEAIRFCAADKRDELIKQRNDLIDRLQKIERNKNTLKKHGII